MKKTYIQPLCKQHAVAVTSSMIAASVKVATGDDETSDVEISNSDDEWVGSKGNNFAWDED